MIVVCQDDMDLHGSLEQLVEIVHTLHKLERDAGKEQLLQLLHNEAAGMGPSDDRGQETATGDDDIEDVPAVCAVAAPTQTEQPHDDVKDIDERDDQEKVGYEDTVRRTTQQNSKR